MDTKSILFAIAVMVLVNALIMAIVSRKMEPDLRSSAAYWCGGTLLIAISGIIFGLGAMLPRTLMLTCANMTMSLGFTSYHCAVRRFSGRPLTPALLIPASIATAAVLFFQLVLPSFQMRVTFVSQVWAWQMFMSAKELINRRRDQPSLAANILTALFVSVGVYILVRNIIYLMLMLPPDFAIENGGNWVNVLTPLLMAPLPIIGTTAFLLMCSDRLQHQLERAANIDFLTGLPNRRGFAATAAAGFDKARTGGGEIGVAIFDVDKFKLINDRYGHETGDGALVQVARKLQSLIRPSDTVARLGGEEFVLLLNGVSDSDAEQIADRLRLAIGASALTVDDVKISITCSVGLALLDGSDTDYEALMRRADRALYRAKANGRNRLEVDYVAH